MEWQMLRHGHRLIVQRPKTCAIWKIQEHRLSHGESSLVIVHDYMQILQKLPVSSHSRGLRASNACSVQHAELSLCGTDWVPIGHSTSCHTKSTPNTDDHKTVF